VFIVATITSVDWSLLSFSDYPPFSDIVASVALTFFAFLGFSVITFSAGISPIPRAGCRERCIRRWAWRAACTS
jgi:hypothetical protein